MQGLLSTIRWITLWQLSGGGRGQRLDAAGIVVADVVDPRAHPVERHRLPRIGPERDGMRIGRRIDRAEREDGEAFKDFVQRVSPAAFEPIVAGFKEERELNRDSIDAYMDWDKTIIYKLERGEGECAL